MRIAGSRRQLVLFAAACLATAGCGQRIDTLYGRSKGSIAPKSVNGTAVLAEMFEKAGHQVATRDKLTPRLAQRSDCIVWFPDDFCPPDEDHRKWFQRWLGNRPGRTLIYVWRDFDAGPWYWNHVKAGAPTEQLPLVRKRLIRARADFRQQRVKIPATKDQEGKWFTADGKYQLHKVSTLQSTKAAWLEGVDPAGVAIELAGRIAPATPAEVLLKSKDDVLLFAKRLGKGRLIVAANGSFLLNLPLVNREHRKLAGKLIDEVGPPAKNVVFLESSAGGPTIYDKDPTATMPNGMEIFSVWPTNWILLHLAAVGIIFCFARLPIFGRPRQLDPPRLADFGEHIRATAELLQRSGDHDYATSRVQHYQQTTKEE